MSDYRLEDKEVKLPKNFIKFGKKEHMIQMIGNGVLHVEPSITFSKSNQTNNAIYDNYDGCLYYPIRDLYVFPLINEKEQLYGKGIKLANSSELRVRNDLIDKTPIFCLYKYDFDIINSIIKLDPKILLEFSDYDYAVIILKPLSFLKQIKKYKNFYANSIIYKNSTPSENDISNKIHYLFYKKENYSYQAEFRIAFIEEQKEKGYEFEIGSILEYSLLVPLDSLRKGLLIAESYEKGKELIEEYKNKYNMDFGECIRFED